MAVVPGGARPAGERATGAASEGSYILGMSAGFEHRFGHRGRDAQGNAPAETAARGFSTEPLAGTMDKAIQ
ncbi:MAG: hypothetical protein HYV63_32655 [Candidatus Schekmanbacteria bacterium]|nr:hypothetical protein [Candidatus Schekmanbacteria bacterium]